MIKAINLITHINYTINKNNNNNNLLFLHTYTKEV